MPRYYLHLRERDGMIADQDGIDFPDLQAAMADAKQSIREMVAERIASAEELDIRSIQICDETGRDVGTVTLAAAISATIAIPEEAFEGGASRLPGDSTSR